MLRPAKISIVILSCKFGRSGRPVDLLALMQ
jgi:hypothetical protein